MTYKKISLFLIAVLTIVLIFNIPFYNNWLNTKFGEEVARISEESGHMSTEERMATRFGTTYLVLSSLKRMLNQLKAENAVILLPPREFVEKQKLENGSFEVPEPAVFYYFTGFKAVVKTSPEVGRANWALTVQNHRMAVKHINDRQYLDSLLIMYKPYN